MRRTVMAGFIGCALLGAAYAQPDQKVAINDKVPIAQTPMVAPGIRFHPNQAVDLSPERVPYQFLEPEGVTAHVNGKFVLIKWTPIKGAQGYNIYRREPNGSYGSRLNSALITWPTDYGASTKLYDSLLPPALYRLERAHIGRLTTGEFYPNFSDKTNEPALRRLGNLYYQVLLVIGQAYADQAVTPGKPYTYRVRYVDASNQEHDLATEVSVVAGLQRILSQPTGVNAEIGDTEVLLTWNDPPAADTLGGYHVYRSTSASGSFSRRDSIPVLTRVAVKLNGDSLQIPLYGFLDRGLTNYTTYYYYVIPRDPLGNPGPQSAVVKAMPRDLTPPQFPKNINTTAMKESGLIVSWNWVCEDTWVPMPRDEKVKQYRLFRYDDYETAVADTAAMSSYQIATIVENQSQPGVHSTADTVRTYVDAKAVPEKVYWYRVSSEDMAGNVSRKSVAINGLLPDIEAPDSPGPPAAEGWDDHILVSWFKPDMTKKKNQDLSGYLLYRGICGGWHEEICRDEGNIYLYHPYPLHLLKEITDIDSLSHKDYSIPKGSPICYRYALKAYDKTQNLSAMSDSICARLRDRTPPDPPIVTALQARNHAIYIEAIAPPIQDMSGFVVERADTKDGTYKAVYTDPLPTDRGCHDLPASADSVMANKVNMLAWTDTKADPEIVYWYRVRAFDINNNQSAPSPPVSTFTYEIRSVTKPARVAAQPQRREGGECAVRLTWDGALAEHFVVYRSFTKASGYRQLGPPIGETWYEDSAIAPGLTCWYRVQALASNGDRSMLSDPISVTVAQ